MWIEVFAAFVGAISGGAVLALLTWQIYRKEKLAIAYQKLYKLRDSFLLDKKNLISQHKPEKLKSDIHAGDIIIISADSSTEALLDEFQPDLIELEGLFKAHFIEGVNSLDQLKEFLYLDYARERSRYINHLESNLQNDDPVHREKCKVVREEALKKIEINITKQIFDEVNNITDTLQRGLIRYRLPRLLKMFLYLLPSRWK